MFWYLLSFYFCLSRFCYWLGVWWLLLCFSWWRVVYWLSWIYGIGVSSLRFDGLRGDVRNCCYCGWCCWGCFLWRCLVWCWWFRISLYRWSWCGCWNLGCCWYVAGEWNSWWKGLMWWKVCWIGFCWLGWLICCVFFGFRDFELIIWIGILKECLFEMLLGNCWFVVWNWSLKCLLILWIGLGDLGLRLGWCVLKGL